jgi:hypothetical protein
MIPDGLREIERWLGAERREDEDGADAAFRQVFAVVPRRAPSVGFAARVVRASFRARRPVLDLLAASGWGRGLIAAGLLLAAVACGWSLPALVMAVFSPARVGTFASFVAGMGQAAAGAAGTALGVWLLLIDVGTTLQAAIATPRVASALAACVLVASSSLYGLNRLLAPREEMR